MPIPSASQRASFLPFHASTVSNSTSQFPGLLKRCKHCLPEQLSAGKTFQIRTSFLVLSPLSASCMHLIVKTTLVSKSDAVCPLSWFSTSGGHVFRHLCGLTLQAEQNLPAPKSSGWEMVKEGRLMLQFQLMTGRPVSDFFGAHNMQMCVLCSSM